MKYGLHEKQKDNGDVNTFSYAKPFNVFNVDQIEGVDHLLPELQIIPEETEWGKCSNLEHLQCTLDRYLVSQGVNVSHGGDSACYHWISDRIEMPNKAQFQTEEGYVGTLAHEILHSTGEYRRTGRRDLITEKYEDRKQAYAFEELVVEIGTCFALANYGINGDPEDHISYIASWLKALKNDKRYIFKAAALAEKAFDCLEELADQYQEQETA